MIPAKGTPILKSDFDTWYSVCLVLDDNVRDPLGFVLIYIIIVDPLLLGLIKDLI